MPSDTEQDRKDINAGRRQGRLVLLPARDWRQTRFLAGHALPQQSTTCGAH